MHYSAQLDVENVFRRHVLPDPRRTTAPGLKVLEVGSADVNGSTKEMLTGFGLAHTGVDIVQGPGVDLVVSPGVPLPFADGSFDTVFCNQVFEHDAHFFSTFAEMCRVCHRDGVVIVIVPSAGGEHRFPVDCWRFLPDSMAALASSAGVSLIESWRNELGPFFNLVGVFGHPQGQRQPIPDRTPSLDELGLMPTLQNDYPSHQYPEREEVKGVEIYRKILERMHHVLEPAFYLEIGVESGHSLARATGPAVGVDPSPVLQVELPANCGLALQTSDDYFAAPQTGPIPPIDYAFIDGMHMFEYVLMDFMNVERHSSPWSVIVVDDVLPNHPVQAYRKRETRHWTGDVWKIVPTLRAQRPDLLLLTINTRPTGLLFVIGANPANRTLWDRFDLVNHHALHNIGDPTDEFIHRHDSIDPNDPLLDRIFRYLRSCRARNTPPNVPYLKSLVEGSRPRLIAGQI